MEKIKNKALFVLVFIICAALTVLIIDIARSESLGFKNYSAALAEYKQKNYTAAQEHFAKVPLFSSVKSAALFREARCFTLLKDNENAKKQYNKIFLLHPRSSIAVLSLYNAGVLNFEEQNIGAEKYFKKIIKKYPASQYAAPSLYYLAQINLLKTADASDNKKIKLKEEAIQKLYNYLQTEPSGKFAKSAIDTIVQLDAIKSEYDNLIIAKSYYELGDYTNSKIYMDKTKREENWNDWAKLALKLGDKNKAKQYIEEGLNKSSETIETTDLYKIVDSYLTLFPTQKEGLSRLNGLFKNKKIKCSDYIQYLDCNIKSGSSKTACYKSLYEQYPNGQFAADALANVFLAKYLAKQYSDVDRFGKIHMKKFPNAKSAPMVSYFMGKMSDKTKHHEEANAYFKHTLAKYPDSYYAYRAYLSMNRDIELFDETNLDAVKIVFPYKKSMEKNLVIKLALLGDYDLVEEICKSDDFVQSWIAYKKGQYTRSCILARDAMEKLPVKPDFDDLRWRLVYPIHYWDTITKYRYTNNPVILLSILKEESHFDQNAKSHVGAKGLMQMMPATESELIASYNIQKEKEQSINDIKLGSIYFANLMYQLDNKALFALAAYNGGIGSVRNWQKTIKFNNIDEFVEQIPYSETNNYVKKIIRSYWMYTNIYN